jgi:hypothetical protein
MFGFNAHVSCLAHQALDCCIVHVHRAGNLKTRSAQFLMIQCQLDPRGLLSASRTSGMMLIRHEVRIRFGLIVPARGAAVKLVAERLSLAARLPSPGPVLQAVRLDVLRCDATSSINHFAALASAGYVKALKPLSQ